jgi:hypothetical protein
MQDKFERIIKMVYRDWKQSEQKKDAKHPDEETLACFIEGRLSQEENERIKGHLINCDGCMDALMVSLKVQETQAEEPPPELIARVKDMLGPGLKTAILEIILRLKEKALEIINTTGDVLVGQELVPAPVLRSRSIKDFKDEVTILKDFNDIRTEVKIENKGGNVFNLTVLVKHKLTQKIIKDLRVSLVKDDLELESYLTDSGSVTFEHVLLGKYTVEISTVDSNLASILIDIKT